MNTKRYGLPVIIAASLHGALFLISKEPEIIRDPTTTTPTAIPSRPIPEEDKIEMKALDADEPDRTAMNGPAKPLPSSPDIPAPLRGDEPFTVPVSPYRSSLEPVKTLEGFTGLPAGLEYGIGDLGGVRIPDVGQLDRVPRAVFRRTPIYPDGPRRAGLDGSVTVEFVVGTDGRVLRVEAVKWSHREFVEPAVRAVREWRFEPGTQGGRKVRFRMAVPIEFNAGE